MGIVEQYLSQLNKKKQRFRRSAAVLTALSLLVVLSVSWNLRQVGVAIANDASCGITEHRHTEECPTEKVLLCGFDIEESAEESPVISVEESTEQTVVETIDEAVEAVERTCGGVC